MEAVQIYRRLAAVDPAAFEPDLASALNSLGMGPLNRPARKRSTSASDAGRCRQAGRCSGGGGWVRTTDNTIRSRVVHQSGTI